MDPSASKPSPAASDPEATLDSSISGLASSPNESLPGQLRAIGPYQLLRLLGEGGMGQVWLAEQTSPVRRMVALKLIRVGLYDSVVLTEVRHGVVPEPPNPFRISLGDC